MVGTGIGFETFQYFHAIDLGKFQIQKHQSRRSSKGPVSVCSVAEEKIQGLLSVASNVNVVCKVFFTKSMEGQLHIVLIVIVFYQQDLVCWSVMLGLLRYRCGMRFDFLVFSKSEVKRRPLIQFGRRPASSAMFLDNALHGRQPHARAFEVFWSVQALKNTK